MSLGQRVGEMYPMWAYFGYDEPSELDVAAALAEVVRKAPKRRLPALALAIIAVVRKTTFGTSATAGASPRLSPCDG